MREFCRRSSVPSQPQPNSSELLKPLFKFGVRKLSPPYRAPLLGSPGTINVEE